MLNAQDVLARIGAEPMIRDYLRGLEEGSEAARDAEHAMLAAIDAVRAGGVHDAMAAKSPQLFARACLLLCRMWSDAEDASASLIIYQYNAIVLLLRHDPTNVAALAADPP